MKKSIRYFLLLAIMLISMPSQAQIKLGLKGGLNVTDMSLSSDVVDASNRTGFFIGPTVRFNLPIIGLGIDASALYDQRDAKLDVEGFGDKKISRKSINIPINARYGVGLGTFASVFLFAGPQFSFNVGDKDIKEIDWEWKSSELSFNVGAGLMFLKKLEISANYNIVCGKSGEYRFEASDMHKIFDKGRANAWQISAAYYF